MCGPYVHYVVEREAEYGRLEVWTVTRAEEMTTWNRAPWGVPGVRLREPSPSAITLAGCVQELASRRFPDAKRIDIILAENIDPSDWKGGRPCCRAVLSVTRPWAIRAGVNIATGKPVANPGEPELTEDEKDTLRLHFVSEYPTAEDLYEKHIRPHFGKRGDVSEWVSALLSMLAPAARAALYSDLAGASTRLGMPFRFIEFAWEHPDEWVDAWWSLWRKPENRWGYWANKQELPREPEKPVSFKWDANKNSHAELLETT